jgi:cytidyltransferase-like protein
MSEKTVMVSGCFDLLHAGHVAFFKTAAQYGKLHVFLGRDENLKQLKRQSALFFTGRTQIYGCSSAVC